MRIQEAKVAKVINICMFVIICFVFFSFNFCNATMDFLSNNDDTIQYNIILIEKMSGRNLTRHTHSGYCNMAPKAGLHNMEFKNEEITKLTFCFHIIQ